MLKTSLLRSRAFWSKANLRKRPMRLHPSPIQVFVYALLAGGAVGGAGVASFAADELVISQKNRHFNPAAITVMKGQPLIIINDDGDLVHHAYVESDAFNFDSGDQNPGSRTSIVFPVRGVFQVLCGIHPKMKLEVHVK